MGPSCVDDPISAPSDDHLRDQIPALLDDRQQPGLEPTNNFGERCLRHAVMYRKTSFGTQGPEGSRFVERILTAVTTLKLQQRGALTFLTETLHAHRRGLPTPSLLPSLEALPLANAA
nr:transposase [Myxococcus qinghaiensis]